jgi:hypothetical protein
MWLGTPFAICGRQMPLDAIQCLLSHASLNTTTFDTLAERTRSFEKVKSSSAALPDFPFRCPPNRSYTTLQSCKPVLGCPKVVFIVIEPITLGRVLALTTSSPLELGVRLEA